MIKAFITQVGMAGPHQLIGLQLVADESVVVHEHSWQVSAEGADHVLEELEAACRRMGIDSVDVKGQPADLTGTAQTW